MRTKFERTTKCRGSRQLFNQKCSFAFLQARTACAEHKQSCSPDQSKKRNHLWWFRFLFGDYRMRTKFERTTKCRGSRQLFNQKCSSAFLQARTACAEHKQSCSPDHLKALRVSAAYKSHRTAPQIEDGGGHPLQGLALAKLLDLLKNRKVARIPRLCNDVELAVELTDHGIVNVGKFFKTEFLPGNNGRDELFTFE